MDQEELIDQSLANDLGQLISDKNPVVQKQALMLVLQYSTVKSNRILFFNKSFIRYIISLIGNEDLTATALSIIIQFSQDDEFINELLNHKVAYRICELINDIVLNNIKNKMDFMQNETLHIELGLLALSNITQSEEGKYQFMSLDQDEVRQLFHFRMFTNFLIDPRTQFQFQHFQQSLLNLSSNEKCRQILTNPQHKIFEVLKQLLKSTSPLIIHILKNLLFEYENEQTLAMICNSQLIDAICEFLINDITNNIPILFNQQQLQISNNENSSQQKSIELLMQRIVGANKCLLILSNPALDGKVPFNPKLIQHCIQLLRQVKYLDSTDLDQVDVIETCYQAPQQ